MFHTRQIIEQEYTLLVNYLLSSHCKYKRTSNNGNKTISISIQTTSKIVKCTLHYYRLPFQLVQQGSKYVCLLVGYLKYANECFFLSSSHYFYQQFVIVFDFQTKALFCARRRYYYKVLIIRLLRDSSWQKSSKLYCHVSGTVGQILGQEYQQSS